jgi:hypothetical protein
LFEGSEGSGGVERWRGLRATGDSDDRRNSSEDSEPNEAIHFHSPYQLLITDC